jgi:PKD repeat protein
MMMVKARFFCLLTLLSTLLIPSIFAATPTKDLYYFVIDRSGSIGEKKLVEPFHKAVVDFVRTLPSETQVEVVFFSDSATRPRSWYPMDLKAMGEFDKYFNENFKPGGQTLLYATLADVLSRVLAKEKEFRNVNVVWFSDGEDNQSGPKFTKLSDVEQFLPEKWVKERKGFSMTWAGIGGFTPSDKDRPGPNSIIRILPDLKIEDLNQAFFPPPRATFSAKPSKVKVNEYVFFELYDDTGVASVQWSFGDGATSLKKTATHQYKAEGNYDISVTAKGPGGTAKADMKGYVKVVAEVPLEGRFSWFPVLVRTGEEVKFTDESLGAPTVWNWEFEGLGSKKDHNPTVAFVKPGKTKVTLAVAKEGASHSFMQEIDVLPLPPDPSFTADPPELEIGQVLNLKATKNENEWTHTWIIGGDTIKTGVETTWTADKLGRVDVQHAVKGPGGLVEKPFTVVVKEKPVALVAKFKWSPVEVRVGEKVQLVDESSGAPDAWVWDVEGVGVYRDQHPMVVFNKTGSYSVTLSAERKGLKSTMNRRAEVKPQVVALVARFSVSDVKGRAPLTVQFSDKSTGAIARWEWDFGDGKQSDAKSPRHTYDGANKYNPRLTIFNSQGAAARDPGDTFIKVIPPRPLWMKVLWGLLGLLLVWILIIVPLILKPLIAPHRGVVLRGSTNSYIRVFAARGVSNILWPRGTVTIGTGKLGDVKVGGVGKKDEWLASIHRIPATCNYEITPLKSDSVCEVKPGAAGAAQRQVLPPRKPRLLRNADQYEVSGTLLHWGQPESKKPTKR